MSSDKPHNNLDSETNNKENPVEVILEAVPENKKEEVKEALMIIRSETYSGPIPPPKALAEYEQIQPGAADRILKMAEKQQDHRMLLEKKAIFGQVEQSKRGQIFGFIIVFLCVAVAVFFAIKFEMLKFAATFLSVTMVILLGLFLNGKSEIKRDLKKKSKDQDVL
ncbi:MAG: DUF2335 domain-containing protein [Bacteroidaceae bacterium]|nr:DUF2335 domain-containing protein [Bacteroidaceae bacterium]